MFSWCLVLWVSLYFEYQPVIGCVVGKNISHSAGSCFVQMKVSFTLQKLFSFIKTHLLIVDHSANVNSVQKVFSSTSKFKAIPYFLLYQVQCSWFYFEVVHPFGVEFWVITVGLFGFLYMLTTILTRTIIKDARLVCLLACFVIFFPVCVSICF